MNGVGVLKREEINILSLRLREIILPYKEEWKQKYFGKTSVGKNSEIIMICVSTLAESPPSCLFLSSWLADILEFGEPSPTERQIKINFYFDESSITSASLICLLCWSYYSIINRWFSSCNIAAFCHWSDCPDNFIFSTQLPSAVWTLWPCTPRPCSCLPSLLWHLCQYTNVRSGVIEMLVTPSFPWWYC